MSDDLPHYECIRVALRNGTVDPRERTLQLREEITVLRSTIHGVECYEAWRADEPCPHEEPA